MPKGQKTPPEVIYAVMASWAITNSFAETSRGLKVPVKTVEKVVKENKDKPEFQELISQTKDEFADNASRIIRKAMKRLEDTIDNKKMLIPVNHLTTVIGTLYDKHELAVGNATEKVEVEIKLPKDAEQYAE